MPTDSSSIKPEQDPKAPQAWPQPTLCDGNGLLRCLRAGSVWLDAHIEQINALNVFPVPDGDTGTNMSLTMRAALDEAGTRTYASVAEVMRTVAHGALMGARGNSGVILSQVMRGFARALDNLELLTPEALAAAFTEGAVTAYKGVVKPVEGTMLTVARDAAQAAQAALTRQAGLLEVLESALVEAEASLARTPSLLPVLAEAGVVDAGGQGLVVLLQGILRSARGESVEPVMASAWAATEHERAHPPQGEYNYDTQFVILGDALDVDRIRERILGLGDSVLVVGDHHTVKVHVHTDCPGQALDYGISQGRVTSVIVDNMQLQYEAFVAASAPAARPAPPATAGVTVYNANQRLSDTGVIAVVAGDGLTRVFESLGVDAVVPGGQTMNPSTQELLTAIEGVACDKVIVLPNNSNIILAAQQARVLSSKQVLVVPSKTVPQGIAALLAFNYQASAEANAAAMQEAIAEVQTAEITRAVRSVQVNGLAVTEGQLIGLLNGDLVAADENEVALLNQLLQRMEASNYEILTMYYGEDVTPERAEALAEAIRSGHPNLEVEVIDGGQSHYYYVISVE